MMTTQTVMSPEWPGDLFGGYFAPMGLFTFGCASGDCFSGNCTVDSKNI